MTMPEATGERSEQAPDPVVSGLWQAIRFVLHLACVYLVAAYGALWLSGRFHDWVLPLFDREPVSTFQFLFSHLFVFNVSCALVAALAYSRYRHRVACYVWIVPAAVLAYKLLAFGIGANHSVLGSTFHESAFHHYFGGGFSIPEYHSYRELLQIGWSNPDMHRGFDQKNFTAPFYAGGAYSVVTFLAIRLNLPSIVDLLRRLRRD